MKKLSFPIAKLGNFICEVKEKVKKPQAFLKMIFTVYGGQTQMVLLLSNNKASDDLGNYTVLREKSVRP